MESGLNPNKQFIIDNFPLDGLFEVGFFKKDSNFDQIETRIKEFFGLDDIKDYATIGLDVDLKNDRVTSKLGGVHLSYGPEQALIYLKCYDCQREYSIDYRECPHCN